MKSDIFVILTFDVSTNQKINNFFKELFTDEKLMITPHITIAHFTNISEKKITKHSNKIMDQFETKNLILKPTQLDYLTSNIVACFFNENSELTNLHYEYNKKYIKKLHYRMLNENWIPHCTVYLGSNEKAQEIYEKYKNTLFDFDLQIDRLQLSKIVKNEDFNIIYSRKFIIRKF